MGWLVFEGGERVEALGVTEGAVTQKVPLGPTKGAEMGWGVRSPPGP